MIIQAIPVFALTGQTLALQNLSTSGIIARTGAGTLSARTLTGTSNQVSVSNGDGVAGNPTFSIPQDIHTGATPQFAGLTLNIDASFNYSPASTINNSNAGGYGVAHYLQSEGVTMGSIGARPSSGNGIIEFGVKSSLAIIYPVSLTASRLSTTADINFGIGTDSFGTSATNTCAISTGTAPSTSPEDSFQVYSADFAAGNACPFFRTENGTIVKLNQNVGTDGTPSFTSASLGALTPEPGAKGLQVKGASPTTVYESQVLIAGSETSGAADTGGAIAFYGHDGSITRGWGYVRCFKENATVDNTASYMAFGNRAAGAAAAEAMRLTSTGQLLLGRVTPGASATKTIGIANGTAPSDSPSDGFQLYSADQAAGNACPHFRTENGKVIKLYQQAHIADATDAATVITRCNAILAALENLGLLATS